MRIIDINDGRTNYALIASVNAKGDLVLTGSDLSPSIKAAFHTDEYEYFYVVKAADLSRLCTALGTTKLELFARLRELLEPHGITASTAWKAWLVDHGIPYEFSVWR